MDEAELRDDDLHEKRMARLARERAELARLHSIEESLRQISRMRLMPDDKINRVTLHAAIEVAKLHFGDGVPSSSTVAAKDKP
jgi:hypothetical protein